MLTPIKLVPGPELDAALEEVVMGQCVHIWRGAGRPSGWMDTWQVTCGKCGEKRSGSRRSLMPVSGKARPFSTTYEIMAVVEHMRADGWDFFLSTDAVDVNAEFHKDKRWHDHDDANWKLAIAGAALSACGMEVET